MRASLATVVLLLLLVEAAAQTMSVDPAHPIVIEAPLNADPPSSFVVNITADRTTNWIVTGLPKWLKADATFGRTPATVTFTVTPPGKTVGASYGATLFFTNLRTRLGDTARAVAVEVVPEEPKPAPNATWRLDGAVTPASFTNLGTVLRFAYVATNSGDAPIAGATLLPTLDASCPSQDLKSGETLSCAFNHAVTQADLDAGRVLDTTVLKSMEVLPPSLRMSLTAIHAFPLVADNGSWRVENVTLPMPTSYVSTDEQIDFTVKVSNLSQQPINYSVLSLLGWLCQGRLLDPGASETCSMSHVTTQEDIDAGIVQLGIISTIVNDDWANRLQLPASAAYTPPYVLLCGDGPCLDHHGGRLVVP